MGKLPEPQFQARAKAHFIRARAGAIADVAGRISGMEVEKLQPEEWEIILSEMKILIKELTEEYDDFSSHVQFLIP